ncbi:MAG: PPC domain-containing DNA-binding protein [Peptococcales bacterium]
MTIVNIAQGSLGKIHAFRLTPDSDLLESLEEFIVENNIKTGLILSGVASLKQAVLRNPKLFPDSFPMTDAYRVLTKLQCPLELLSLSGNITELDGKPFVHAHIVISKGDDDGLAFGGHLDKGCIIFSTAEIIIAEINDMKITREKSLETFGKEFTPTN